MRTTISDFAHKKLDLNRQQMLHLCSWSEEAHVIAAAMAKTNSILSKHSREKGPHKTNK